jgi:hypothetical protein
VIHAGEPNKLVAARKGAHCCSGSATASTSWRATRRRSSPHADVIYLDDGEMAVVTRDGYRS